jgi:hypothetical protein
MMMVLTTDGMRRLQGEDNVNSTSSCPYDCCVANYEQQICGVEEEDSSSFLSAVPIPVQIIFIIILLSLSAIFSGLTLGLMSLDLTGLEIVMAGDDPKLAQCAKDIYPIRKRGNLLLCTLLLGNVSVNSLLSIFMANFTNGIIGFLTSTVLIVIFGEILPQALVRLTLVLNVHLTVGHAYPHHLVMFPTLFRIISPVFSTSTTNRSCNDTTRQGDSCHHVPVRIPLGRRFRLDVGERIGYNVH